MARKRDKGGAKRGGGKVGIFLKGERGLEHKGKRVVTQGPEITVDTYGTYRIHDGKVPYSRFS